MPLAWISLTLSRHFSQSFIASGRSSGLHPVSSHSCCMYVRAGRPAFAWPYVGVHRSISLMSSSLLLQQCSVCLVRLTCIVFVMGGRWPYSWCLIGCCRSLPYFPVFHENKNLLVSCVDHNIVVHRRRLLINLSLLLQQYQACLAHLSYFKRWQMNNHTINVL